MIRWLAYRMMHRCDLHAERAAEAYRNAWTGQDQLDWERVHQRWVRRAERWQGWL